MNVLRFIGDVVLVTLLSFLEGSHKKKGKPLSSPSDNITI
ncbi:hypothetical protein VCHA54P496_10348 [Vibrio chagasii]|nr:hypothetical protein VCHA54P495_10348 [Vibrio chagasii]CAH7076074.1 hypothetical protein VCHA54P496_10348 [Vibrio chagasii]CAH7467838.1 hypothetical protein VCHA54P486_50026 [Vibrio chagasii]